MTPGTENRRPLAWILATVFLFAMFMGSGPGLLIANTPTTVPIGFGLALPSLYAWGLLWYGVEATCIFLAYFLVWSRSDEDTEETPVAQESGEA